MSLTVSPVKDREGNIIGASKIARDISERKQSEELKNRLAAVVQFSDDAIISKTLAGRYHDLEYRRGADFWLYGRGGRRPARHYAVPAGPDR